jgi:hypothetical protein|tara:strand:+ start:363 stop:587 length:225 start_codon:yes stop_codon:yes gene_type:complete
MNDIKLNDNVIAHLVKLLQIGILTGTDVVDQFRMIRLTIEEGELFLDKEYEKNQEASIEKMLKQASEAIETQEQ